MKNQLLGTSYRHFPNYLKCCSCNQYYIENHAHLDYCFKLKDLWEQFDVVVPANDNEMFSPQRLA